MLSLLPTQILEEIIAALMSSINEKLGFSLRCGDGRHLESRRSGQVGVFNFNIPNCEAKVPAACLCKDGLVRAVCANWRILVASNLSVSRDFSLPVSQPSSISASNCV